MVHEVVALGPELELPAFRQLECLEQRSIPLRLTRRTNLSQIAREGADVVLPLISGGAFEKRRVEPLRNTTLRGRQRDLVVTASVEDHIAEAQRWTALNR